MVHTKDGNEPHVQFDYVAEAVPRVGDGIETPEHGSYAVTAVDWFMPKRAQETGADVYVVAR